MQMPKGVTKGVGETSFFFFFFLVHQKRISEPSWNDKKKTEMVIRWEGDGDVKTERRTKGRVGGDLIVGIQEWKRCDWVD